MRAAEDGWNTRDPQRVALVYTPESRWRNRSEFFSGRDAIVMFLIRRSSREVECRLVKEMWAFDTDRIAVRFAYEWHYEDGAWFRFYGNEDWRFDASGLRAQRHAGVNDVAAAGADRKFRWDLAGARPGDRPGLSGLVL